MLKIHGLKKRFGNFQALNGLEMEIEEGALYGFVGPNGAGKTTAIRIVTGLLLPDEGTVEIAGKDALKYREEVKTELKKLMNKAEVLSDADNTNIRNETWKEVKQICSTLLLMVDRLEKK